MKKIFLFMIITLGVTALSACSSGGGGGGGTIQPTTATIKISTEGTLTPGSQIGGIDLTLTLPSGVLVKSTADTNKPSMFVTNNGVVVVSGVAAGSDSINLATYAAATSFTAGKVVLNVVNPNGFGIGEFVTVNCDIAPGNYPKATDFGQTVSKVVDLNGKAITGLTFALTAEIK